jgi:hypothetical protein
MYNRVVRDRDDITSRYSSFVARGTSPGCSVTMHPLSNQAFLETAVDPDRDYGMSPGRARR